MDNTLLRLKIIRNHLYGAIPENRYNSSLEAKDEFSHAYILPNNLLSTEQQQFYKDNGFLVIDQLIPEDILDECRKRFLDICKGKVPKGGMTLMKDVGLVKSGAKGEFLYNKAQEIAYDEVFATCLLYPKLLDYVECFTGPNIMAMHSMLINKPPDVGIFSSEHPFHQDLHYFPFRPANRIVAMWTAMERITVDNGCLIVFSGTQKGTLQRHTYLKTKEGKVNKMYHGIEGCNPANGVNLIMNKGDTVFFHPLLIHGSGPNVTMGCRKAISCHYAASECNYIDVKGTMQEHIAKEAEEVAQRKGYELDYCTVWRVKSRLVRGIRINL